MSDIKITSEERVALFYQVQELLVKIKEFNIKLDKSNEEFESKESPEPNPKEK